MSAGPLTSPWSVRATRGLSVKPGCELRTHGAGILLCKVQLLLFGALLSKRYPL